MYLNNLGVVTIGVWIRVRVSVEFMNKVVTELDVLV